MAHRRAVGFGLRLNLDVFFALLVHVSLRPARGSEFAPDVSVVWDFGSHSLAASCDSRWAKFYPLT